ncbi:MAG TPA: Ig-like domain-containing protein [Vicinamibacterales bacterium]|nr:Ig-like domain-containing protein [Vicinamibacterales bacterium]
MITVLSVRRPAPEVLEIRYPEDGVTVGRTLELNAYGYWRTPIEWFEDVTSVAAWKSSNSKIATVSSSGVVMGRAPGKVIISASVDGLREDVSVVVSGAR